MERTEDLVRVLPFLVSIISVSDGMAKVLLPESIQTEYGSKVVIPENARVIAVNVGSNMYHNIRRDVRKFIRKRFGLLASFKYQNELIVIKDERMRNY